jgi:hypothetical protein
LSANGPSADGGDFLSDDIMTALELSTLSNEEDCFISLNAITGTQSNNVIHLIALVGNQVLSILVDFEALTPFLTVPCLLGYLTQWLLPLV